MKKVGSVLELQRGYDLPTRSRVAGEIPIISSSGYSGYHDEFKCDGENVITGRYGTIGNVYYYNGKCWPLNTSLYVKDFKGNIPKYIYYFLKNTLKLYQVNGNDKSAVPGIDRKIIHEMCVPFHEDTDYQNDICSVLNCLDHKITTNSNICSELEAMAKTIYDYWFVQFDFPDENGKPYRTSGGEMVWNEQLKREIPKGWEAGKLCDIANITMGQSPTGESYNDIGDGLIFYQGRTDFGLRFPTPRMYTTAPARFAQKGDILLSVRAPVGDLNFAMEDCCIGRGLAALNSKLGSQMHLFYTLTGFQQIFKVMDGNGTTFGSITKDILFGMAVVIPSDEILKCFDKMVKPIKLKIEKCEEEIRELTKLRDWLLPMLMNGQARVE